MRLSQCRVNQVVSVVSIDDPEVRARAIRLGLCEGCRCRCVAKLPGGPVVLALARRELAVGRGLAERIEVAL